MKIKLKSPASRYDAVIRPNRRRTGREIGIPGFPQRGGATAASGIMRSLGSVQVDEDKEDRIHWTSDLST